MTDSPELTTGDARREQFVEAALELLQSFTPGEISMDDIAHHADVSRPLIYTYFADRDALLIAAFHAFFAGLQAEVDKIIDSATKGDARLREIVHSYLVFARDNEQQYRHLLDGGLLLHPDIRAARKTRFKRLAEAFWADSDDAVLVATTLVGILETAALAWLDQGGRDVDHATDLVFRLAWRGLANLAV